jgi:DNA replication protein DnaC
MSDFDFDMSEILACEPKWVTCKGCKQQVQMSPCWDCVKLTEEGSAESKAEERLGLPARFRWATIDSPELVARSKPTGRMGEPVRVSDVAAQVRAWGGTAIAFVGPSGAGKTSLAVACIRDLPGALIVPAQELERARAEHRLGDGEARIVDRAIRARVLLLEDLGQGVTAQQSAIADVVNKRHDAERPTWYTTGLSMAQIEARYGAGVRRRLTERGTAMIVRFGEVAR